MKKLLIVPFLSLSCIAGQQQINIGSGAYTGTSDSGYILLQKSQSNFTDLYGQVAILEAASPISTNTSLWDTNSVIRDGVIFNAIMSANVSGYKPLASKNLYGWGDSIGQGYYAMWPYDNVTLTNNFIKQVQTFLGGTLLNYSQSGFAIADQYINIYTTVVDTSTVSIWELGVNDYRNVADSSYYTPLQLGQLCWLAIPENEKIRGTFLLTNSSNSSLIATNWATTASGIGVASHPGIYINTSSSNSLVVSNLAGTTIVVGQLFSSATGYTNLSAIYSVDGVGVLTNNNGIAAYYALSWPNKWSGGATIISGLTTNSHVLTIKWPTNTANNGIDYITSSSMWTNKTPVFVMEILNQASNYVHNGNQAGVDALNSQIHSNMTTLRNIGLPIYFCPLNTVLDPNWFYDGLHPAKLGAFEMSSAVEYQFGNWQKDVILTNIFKALGQ